MPTFIRPARVTVTENSAAPLVLAVAALAIAGAFGAFIARYAVGIGQALGITFGCLTGASAVSVGYLARVLRRDGTGVIITGSARLVPMVPVSELARRRRAEKTRIIDAATAPLAIAASQVPLHAVPMPVSQPVPVRPPARPTARSERSA
jgi:hypothetical protein